MPRPRVDSQSIRETIIKIAETLILETEGRRLVLSDIADRMGVSQPYIYSHFRNKHELVAELTARWFHTIEEAEEKICAKDMPWQCKLRELTLSAMTIKKEKFLENPELFLACLRMAEPHGDVISIHIEKHHRNISMILSDVVPPAQLERMTMLVVDATIAFRVPIEIARHPERATPERLDEVLSALIHYLESSFSEQPLWTCCPEVSLYFG